MGRAAGDLLHLDKIIDPGAGVFPADAVQLHPGPAPQLLVGRHGLADRGPFAHDLHDVTDGHLEFFQVFRPHAGIGPPHVFAEGLRHFQLEGQRLQFVFIFFIFFLNYSGAYLLDALDLQNAVVAGHLHLLLGIAPGQQDLLPVLLIPFLGINGEQVVLDRQVTSLVLTPGISATTRV